MYPHFFTAEEAFVRLGQNRQKGCLVIFNKLESAHIFVNEGVVNCALCDKRYGEGALAHAMHMEDATWSWLAEAEPVINNIQLSINKYALQHSIARDTHAGRTVSLPKQATKALPKEELLKKFHKKEITLEYLYYFTDEEKPTVKLKLNKISNIVGRDELCDLVLGNPEVSRRHCIIQVTERGLLIKDLDSTNGTYANGIAMTDGYINRGDRLSLGRYELTLHIERNMGDKTTSYKA